jgi:subtilisin family serine protease
MLPGVFLLIQLLQFTPCTAKPLPVAAASIIANSYAGNISIHQLTDQTTTTTTTHNHISQQYLLRLKQSQQQPLATDLLIQLQTLIKQQTGLSIDITAINQITNAFQGLIVKTDIPLPVEWIQQQVPFIDMVEQDHPWTSQQVQSQLGDRGWGLDRLDSTISNRPLDSSYTFDSTGKNVNVYVVDSGIDAGHGEFGGRAETVYHSPRFTDSVDCQGTTPCIYICSP